MRKQINWQETVALHLADDGGGLFDELKALRRGTLADLVRYIALLESPERERYEIERVNDHRMKTEEIMDLYGRADFPHAE